MFSQVESAPKWSAAATPPVPCTQGANWTVSRAIHGRGCCARAPRPSAVSSGLIRTLSLAPNKAGAPARIPCKESWGKHWGARLRSLAARQCVRCCTTMIPTVDDSHARQQARLFPGVRIVLHSVTDRLVPSPAKRPFHPFRRGHRILRGVGGPKHPASRQSCEGCCRTSAGVSQ